MKGAGLKLLQRLLPASGDDDGPPIWMTVYGDMMTNLMLFFLMMFAFNLVGEGFVEKAEQSFREAAKGEKVEAAPTASDAAKRPLDEFIRSLRETQENIEVTAEGQGVRLRMPEPILFDPGRAELKPEAEAVLKQLAEGLSRLEHLIVVEGHTDDRPLAAGNPYKSNWELSAARSEAVVNRLTALSVPSPRLAVAGYGEHRPFVPNEDATSRALNRRIELLLILEDAAPGAASAPEAGT